MSQPAQTGPMRAPWTDATPHLLAALQQLKLEVTRAQNAAQVGAPIDEALYRAVADVVDAEATVYDPKCLRNAPNRA